MRTGFTALLVGLLFGAGLTISGMTMPQKVIGFLDLFGNWDPSLAFVMIGAIAVHLVAYRIIRHRTSPLLADSFYIPEKRGIDRRLMGGSLLFGAGWGLGGYCPGPAITALVSMDLTVWGFVGSMLAGMLLHHVWERYAASNAKSAVVEVPKYDDMLAPLAHDFLKRNQDAMLIDVRSPSEYAMAHAAGAINQPLQTLDAKTLRDLKIQKNQALVLICMTGARSERAGEIIHAAGYTNLINVIGGTNAWLANDLPVDSKKDSKKDPEKYSSAIPEHPSKGGAALP